MVGTEITNSFINIIDQFIAFIPTLVAIIILIIVGKIVGTFLGKLGARFLDKIGLDDLVDKTIIGGMIKRAQMSTVGFFDAVIRWFIYIIFAMIILDLLNIEVVNNFISMIILYIPLMASFAAFMQFSRLSGSTVFTIFTDSTPQLRTTSAISMAFETFPSAVTPTPG